VSVLSERLTTSGRERQNKKQERQKKIMQAIVTAWHGTIVGHLYNKSDARPHHPLHTDSVFDDNTSMYHLLNRTLLQSYYMANTQ